MAAIAQWPRRVVPELVELVRIASRCPRSSTTKPFRIQLEHCRSFHQHQTPFRFRGCFAPPKPRTLTSKARNGRTDPPPAGPRLLAAGAGVGGLLSVLLALSWPASPDLDTTSTSHIEIDDPPVSSPKPVGSADGRDPSRPRFRLSDVRKHDARSPEPWVTSGDKVYDITDWVAAHPGGEIILRAAGGSIDPFWEVFSIHKAPYVREILEQYMIGFIDAADLIDGKAPAASVESLFKDDPMRDARLITHTATPRNAETPNDELGRDFLTPNGLFYVRNHMWVPVVENDAKDHVLHVELPDGEVKRYTMDDLRRRFQTHTVTAVLQCSGNRRSDMSRHVAKTNGLPWGVGAISNAEWEGVRLADVLADAGLVTAAPAPPPPPPLAHAQPTTTTTTDDDDDDESPDSAAPAAAGLHVQFAGLEGYGASIPLPTVLDPRNDVLLAFGMNGQPLPRDHGYPLRAVVPGHVAARSVKWLSKIVVADEESTSQWQRRDYKCFGPNEGDKPDWDRYPAIQEMPITSAVTGVWVGECVRRSRERWMMRRRPAAAAAAGTTATEISEEEGNDDDRCKRAPPGVRDVVAWQKTHLPAQVRERGEPVAVTGYAYSGGGRQIVRVDISVDGGRTWDQAELLPDDCDGQGGGGGGGGGCGGCKGNKAWSWKRWRYMGSLPEFSSSSSSSPSPGPSPSSSVGADGEKKEAKEKTMEDGAAAACTEIVVKATDEAYNTQPEHHSGIFNIRGNLATAWHRVRVCPSCTTTKDGKKVWQTGDGVYGCGFR